MTTVAMQLELDLWPHQRGYVRMPYDSAGPKTGDVVPAWVCCRCGRPELSEFTLDLEHGCCEEGLIPECGDPYPFDLTPYWMPDPDLAGVR